jgi:hypothetical protein
VPSRARIRQHWHARATQLAQLDCGLLGLLPANAPALGGLIPGSFAALTRHIGHCVDQACEAKHLTEREIEETLAKAIWNFAKTLAPNLPPFGHY